MEILSDLVSAIEARKAAETANLSQRVPAQAWRMGISDPGPPSRDGRQAPQKELSLT
jgi:hypothetical protein